MDPMKFRPLRDRLLVRVDDTPTMRGVLHLPNGVRHNVTSGAVVSVGDEVTDVRPGHRVQFVKYQGSDVSRVMPDHLVLREDDILGREG